MWTNKTFAELGYTYTGLSGKKKSDFGAGEPYIPYMNVFSNEKVDTDAFEYVRIGSGERQNAVMAGDALFTTSSETPQEVGMSSVLTKETENVYLNSFCFGFRFCKPGQFFPGFLAYALRSRHIRHQMFVAAQGSTRHNLSKENFGKMTLCYPTSLEEQRRIANVLTAADEAIDASRAAMDKYMAVKQGLAQDLLGKGLRMRLIEVVEINPFRREKLPESFHYIDLESVTKGKLIKDAVVSRRQAPSRAQRLLQVNDILFQTVRPYQQNNYFFRKERQLRSVASTGYALMRTDNNPAYIYYMLHEESFVREVNNKSTGSNYPAINPAELEKCTVRFEPDRKEQDKIAEILASADKRLNTEQKQLVKLETIKRGLMDDLLTNKVSTDRL